MSVRPERMVLLRPGAEAPSEAASRAGEVREIVYLGDRVHAVVRLGSGRDVLVSLRDAGRGEGEWRRGDPAIVAWRFEDAHPLEDDAHPLEDDARHVEEDA